MATANLPDENLDEQPAASGNIITQLIVSASTQSWLASALVHMIILVVLALTLGTIKIIEQVGKAPTFNEVEEIPEIAPEIEHFEVGDTPVDPTELTTETLTLTEAPSVEAQFNDNSPIFEEAGGGVQSTSDSSFGGLGGFTVATSGLGPVLKGAGGVDGGGGFGTNFGSGGAGKGFGSRGAGSREAMLGSGGTKQSERAVAAALNWLARHQRADGSWSIDHTSACKGGFCSGAGSSASDAGATAMGLLPFLAAGQTHVSKGPYQRNILAAIDWLVRNQNRNGDLSKGQAQTYSHGLATIALCEAYGMTEDSRVGLAAQAALDLIQTNQNNEGSWRYSYPAKDSDTSVYGWQVMALKSGQMAGLRVNAPVFDGAKKYLTLCDSGQYGSQFGYTPGGGGSDAMTAVGLLCSQYLGAKRGDPVITGGVEYLSKHPPKVEDRDIYYWYYATQVMHNVPGAQWDTWNRQMRRILIQTQEKSGCEAGSWDPEKPSIDRWGKHGGRVMMTSLSCLTLEVYYRYLPLYKIDDPKKALEKLN
jgi:hypothetical protein